jgi:Transglycosylase SLT domain/LysM domain
LTSPYISRLSAARNHARTLTVCAAAVGCVVTPAIASAAAGPHTSASSAYHRTVVHTTHSAAAQHPAVASTTAVAVADVTTNPTYQVQAGDTLSGIAARVLGNGNDYHQIFKLNKDQVESDGTRFTDPNLIQIGWTLTLPAGAQTATAPTQQPAAAAATSSDSSSSGSDSSSSGDDSSNASTVTAPTDSSAPSDASSDTSSSTTDNSYSSDSSDGSDSSDYSDDLNGWIDQAQAVLAANGYQVSYNAIYETAMGESSGDPDAVNGWDSNAADGTPSEGLMQVIEPTFEAYALPGYNTDILDPVSNIIAAAVYAQDTYGGLDNVVAARCDGACWSGY